MSSYPDYVRNTVINYRCHNGMRTFSVAGIYGPACVSSLTLDHDYLEKPLHHQWIYNLIQAHADDAEGIQKRTKTQHNCKEWREKRAYLVTASNVGDIVHVTGRRDREAYADKLVNPVTFSTAATLWGKKHEKTAIIEFEKHSYVKVVPCGLFISKECPFIGGSPDGLICAATVLEVKCPNSIRGEKMSAQNLNYLEPNNGELCLKKRSNYYYQVQTQMFVTGRQYCDFVVWTQVDFKRISVDRNDYVIQNEIIPKITEFYDKYMIPAIVKKYYC